MLKTVKDVSGIICKGCAATHSLRLHILGEVIPKAVPIRRAGGRPVRLKNQDGAGSNVRSEEGGASPDHAFHEGDRLAAEF